MTDLAPADRPDATTPYSEALVDHLDDERTRPPVTVAADLPEDRFLDREASWLDFNRRVLDLALDPGVPLLERVKFSAIFATNLDEFFMVRVAGLKRRLATGLATTAPSGLQPREQLELIWRRSSALAAEHAESFGTALLADLAAQGIEILHWDDLHAHERSRLRELYLDRVHPVLTPLAVDPAHPFPYISGLSLNLAVLLRDHTTGAEHFARVKVPAPLPRFVPIGDTTRFVPLEDLIAAHLDDLFPGMEVIEEHAFRVTRNEDVEVEDEEGVNDLLQALERELLRRRFGIPVRLEVESSMSDRVLDLLVRELGVERNEVQRHPGLLDLGGLWSVAALDRPDLLYPSFVSATPARLHDPEGGPVDVFAAMRAGDLLLHHPYDAFGTTVQAFIEQAAADPRVLAIKQTLYRTSGDSPIVDALIDAARAGKQVLVVVEIKARFDEQANIRWARVLEQAGCHVVYGLVGLKTHCKLGLVVRQEDDGTLRRYVHVGTGNYNPKTARLYEDFGLLTADRVTGGDVADLFNHLSSYTRHRGYAQLVVAPEDMRSRLIQRIRAEAAHAAAGRPARITMKLNNLVDEAVIDELYRASDAGVVVDLVVRAMCALRPRVAGLSERIRVRSILGRFLEHSRVYRFENDGDPLIYLGSADVMHRNLDRRVEALVRIDDPAARARIDEVLDLALAPDVVAWELDGDGSWTRSSGTRDHQAELVARVSASASYDRRS